MPVILKAIFEDDRANTTVPFPQLDMTAGIAAFERAKKAHASDGRRLNRVWLIDTCSEQGVVVRSCGGNPTDPYSSELTKFYDWGDQYQFGPPYRWAFPFPPRDSVCAVSSSYCEATSLSCRFSDGSVSVAASSRSRRAVLATKGDVRI